MPFADDIEATPGELLDVAIFALPVLALVLLASLLRPLLQVLP